MATHVFVSHSSKNDDIAEKVRDALISRGISCWVDHKDKKASMRYETQIVNTIEESKCFLLIYSCHVIGSEDIYNELGLAKDAKNSIVPFRLDDTPYPPELKYYLRSVNWKNAFPPPMEDRITELVDEVQKILEEKGVTGLYKSHVEPSFQEKGPANVPVNTIDPSKATSVSPRQKKYDAYIAYSSRDKQVADAIVQYLENKRMKCWIAPRDVQFGNNFARSILEAIENSATFILIYSSNTNNSTYVSREVQFAATNRIPILPFRIDTTPPDPVMNFYLCDSHWIDAMTPDMEEHLHKLSTGIRTLLVSMSADR